MPAFDVSAIAGGRFNPLSSGTANGNANGTNHTPTKKLKFIVLGAGSRGRNYAEAVTEATNNVACIHAVAEPHDYKRTEFGKKFIWGGAEKKTGGGPRPGQEFKDWKDWITYEKERRERVQSGQTVEGDEDGGVDGAFVCVLDEQHIEVMLAVAPLNLHVFCEKPLATSLDHCMAIYRAFTPSSSSPLSTKKKVFSIGHVLRYSQHNMCLRQLLLTDKVIGDVISIEHTEPVGWWHFSHSYVRGNWRRETLPERVGSLLTKSCHDIDFIMWLLSSPPPGSPANTQPHQPRSISSIGTLSQFSKSRKPALAGDATNCLSCPAEKECIYSAQNIYYDRQLAKGDTHWPIHIVCPDIEDVYQKGGKEAAKAHLFDKLKEDYDRNTTPDAEIAARPWYGRCVWESDNNVCDDQVVTIRWDEEQLSDKLHPAKTATMHMIAPTEKQCERRGRVYGTLGELEYDSRTITIYNFQTRQFNTINIPRQPDKEERSHGGGDYGLTRMFVAAVDAVENHGWDVDEAQRQFVGCDLEEAVRSHAVVFAAEEARRDETVVQWKKWWEEKIAS